ncbi:MAG: hypothetical protein GX957_02700 [Clostridiaceae bacterium]|nr:hypothetical protein [Clostridiaceae bacterium]
MFVNLLWMILFIVLTAWAGLHFVKENPKMIWFVILSEIALICRYILVFVIFSNGTETTGTDGLIYHLVAKDVANQIKSGTSIWTVEYKFTWYTVLVGIQYAIFGVNRYAASFANAFFSILTGFFLTDIALNLKFNYKKSSFIGLAYVFMPSMMVWTTDTRKESLTFLVTVIIWYITLKFLKGREWSKYRQFLSISLICLLLWLSTVLRLYMFVTLGGGLLVSLLLHYLKTKRKSTLIFGCTVLVFCIFLVFNTFFANIEDYHALPKSAEELGDESIKNEVNSIIDIILSKNIPRAINGFLTQPHLEDVPDITDISGQYVLITLVRFEMVLWYLCMVVALFGVLDALLRWDPYLLGIIAFIISYTLINALISEEVADTYYRYRAALIAPVLLFADYRPLINRIRNIITRKTLY